MNLSQLRPGYGVGCTQLRATVSRNDEVPGAVVARCVSPPSTNQRKYRKDITLGRDEQ